MTEEVIATNEENLDQIMKAIYLIDNRVFEVIESLNLEDPKSFIGQYREAHDSLSDMIVHLAGMAGVDIEF